MTRYSRTHFGSRDMDQYVIHVLKERQKGLCAICQKPLTKFQIHHKRYGEDITVNDLELIHGECHAEEHGHKGVKGRQRTLSTNQ